MRLRLIWMTAIAILITLTYNPTVSKARSFTIDEVNIQAFIHPNGNVYVEELFTYTFDGEFNGTTRTIGDDKFDGFDFFDGYETDLDTTFQTIDQDQIKPLNVELEEDTFKIHNPAKNETKRILYSYRLQHAAKKYDDVGEFYWRFFDEMNDTDLHNIDIGIYLYDEETLTLPKDADGFIHDLHGGTYEMNEFGLHYENELLPSGEMAEQRFIFPATFLSEMEQTETGKKRDVILNEEKKFEQRLGRLDRWLTPINWIDFLFLLIFNLLLLFAIIYPKRIIRFFIQHGSAELINKTDSLSIVALKRRLRFRYTDINAALFTMHQEGKVRIEYNEQGNERPTFRYMLTTPTASLREHEQFLVNWLFTQTINGEPAFNLDQIPVHDREANNMENYRAKEKYYTFRKQFKRWCKLARKDTNVSRLIKPVYTRKILLYGILPFWFLWGCFHLYLSVQYHVNYAGALSVLIIGLIPLRLKFQLERVWTPIILIGSLIISQFLDMSAEFAMFYVAHITLILFSIFLPSTYPTLKGIDYKQGLGKWHQALQNGSLPIDKDRSAELEKAFQHAIALEKEDVFCHHYLKDINAAEVGLAYPLLIAPEKTREIFDMIHSMSFEALQGASGGGSSSSSSRGSGGGGGAGAF